NPRISVIVVWDNVHLRSSGVLAERSLRCLAAELSMIDQTFEVLVLFDERDRRDVATLTARHFTGFQPTLIEHHAHPYYEMKNAGFAIARGELIVLWDSDIETARGGLRMIIDAFNDPARQVVAGSPFIDPSSFKGRA